MTNFNRALDLRDAVNLLNADLVWSDDFQQIRQPLKDLLQQVMMLPESDRDRLEPALTDLLNGLLKDL